MVQTIRAARPLRGNYEVWVTENYILSFEKVNAILKNIIIIIITSCSRHPRHVSRCSDSLRLSPVCARTPGG